MDEATRYLTTDLDLDSAENFSALVATLSTCGFRIARPMIQLDQQWFCGFSLCREEIYEEPEPQIVAMLTVIESLAPNLRAVWENCTRRVFDIGYDCGREPFSLHQELSAMTLARLAAVGATLRVTLYSNRDAS